MRTLPIVRSQETRYIRDSSFSYTCHACSRCCHDKIIHLNPYEALRLATNRGISTSQLVDRYTEASGTTLKRVEGGACIFLTENGCGVHTDRPLVCRIYPLGRHVTAQGEEWFSELAPHPETDGTYGTKGTVGTYLNAQGAYPYIEAVDRYLDLLGSMAFVLQRDFYPETDMRTEVEQAIDDLMTDGEHPMPPWLDIDAVITIYCAEQHLDIPTRPSLKMDLHIRAIQAWLDTKNSKTRRAR